MKPALRIHHLDCSYRRTEVLRRISFEVPRGEFFIVIGPNGSGKTTLIKALAGLLPVSGGRVDLKEQPLHRIKRKALARQLAYVAQTGAEETLFRVREVVLMGRAPHLGTLGVEGHKDREIARKAMAYADLKHLAERRVDLLSGGERQRVHIARAICQQPELLLLDEPTAALDLAHQIHIMDLLMRLSRDHQTTIIMVSHDINLAAMYADRLLLLVKGRIAACGPATQVIDEKILAEAYGCPVTVDSHPAGPWPRVSLIPKREREKENHV